ncbi:MAG: hypothetical protein SNJ63_08000 [Sphingomonadaceae bacterium]
MGAGKTFAGSLGLGLLVGGCALSHPPLAELPTAPPPPQEFVEVTKQRLEGARQEANATADAILAAQDFEKEARQRKATAESQLASAKQAASNAPAIAAAERGLATAERDLEQAAREVRRLAAKQQAQEQERDRLAALCRQIDCEGASGIRGNPEFTAIAIDSVSAVAALVEARNLGNIYRERYLKAAKLRTALDLPVLGLGAYSAWRAVGGISSEESGAGSSADATLEALARVGIGAGVYTLARDRLLPSGLPATYRNGYDGMACIIGIGDGFLSLEAYRRQVAFNGARRKVLELMSEVNRNLALMTATERDANKALVALAEARKELAAKTLSEAAVQQRAWDSRGEAFGAAVRAVSISVSKGALVPSNFNYNELRTTLAPPAPTPPPAAQATAQATGAPPADVTQSLGADIEGLAAARIELEAAMPDHLARLERLKTCASLAVGQAPQT